MYNQHPPSYHGNNFRQGQRNEQKLIQDQNYSNQIFFGILSTIESIVQYHQGRANDYNNKMFKAYDRVNYSSKSIHELRSQLQSQIFLFQASRKVFEEENKVQWRLPTKFDQNKAGQLLNIALQAFQQKDKVAFALTQDVKSILIGKLDGLYAEKAALKVQYSEQDRKKQRKKLVQNGMMAGEQMDKRAEQIKDCSDRNNLPVNINHHSNGFGGQNFYPIANSSQVSQHNGKLSKMKSQSPNNQPEPMKDQSQQNNSNHPKQDWQILAFNSDFQARQFLRNFSTGSIYVSSNQTYYYHFENDRELLKLKQNLIVNKYIHLVFVKLDKYKKVIKIDKQIGKLQKGT